MNPSHMSPDPMSPRLGRMPDNILGRFIMRMVGGGICLLVVDIQSMSVMAGRATVPLTAKKGQTSLQLPVRLAIGITCAWAADVTVCSYSRSHVMLRMHRSGCWHGVGRLHRCG